MRFRMFSCVLLTVWSWSFMACGSDRIGLTVSPSEMLIDTGPVEVIVSATPMERVATIGYCVAVYAHHGMLSYAADAGKTAAGKVCVSAKECHRRIADRHEATVHFTFEPSCPDDVLTAMLYESSDCTSSLPPSSSPLAMDSVVTLLRNPPAGFGAGCTQVDTRAPDLAAPQSTDLGSHD